VKKARVVLLALAICVLLAFVFRSAIFRGLGEFLVVSEAPEKADIAVVLAGDAAGNRVLKAGELVREGYAPQALVSGPAGVYGFFECDLAIQYAEKKGFPASYFIAFPNRTRSTKEEAAAVVPELRRRGVHTVLLVTSNYHTRRALGIYRTTAPDIRFISIAAPDAYFSPDRWWKEREGRKTFAFEWMKTVTEWVGM
jgi:uncharacterized SAM-binding protein YcdF (DUF218 family)